MNKKVIGIIPARYESSRFPGKPLAEICGKPMLQWVCERAAKASLLDQVMVATDHDRIEELCRKIGITVFRSRREHQTGTDRIIEAFVENEAFAVVNIQGDEPLITPDMIDAAVSPLLENDPWLFPVVTLVKKIERVEDINSPHVVKVVFNRKGLALYFSRSPIPAFFSSDKPGEIPDSSALETLPYYKHIGLYAFLGSFLKQLPSLKPSMLEQIENLEQLRILDNGYSIRCVPVSDDTIGVDTPEDIILVEKMLKSSSRI